MDSTGVDNEMMILVKSDALWTPVESIVYHIFFISRQNK